jgi:hypothetical protein
MHVSDTHRHMKHWVILLCLIEYLRGGVKVSEIEELMCQTASHRKFRVCSFLDISVFIPEKCLEEARP